MEMITDANTKSDILTQGGYQTGEGSAILLSHLDELHTTALGVERIKRNLSLTVEDVVDWCRDIIRNPQSRIRRNGKNWYIENDKCVITVNAHSYTIITCHPQKHK